MISSLDVVYSKITKIFKCTVSTDPNKDISFLVCELMLVFKHVTGCL